MRLCREGFTSLGLSRRNQHPTVQSLTEKNSQLCASRQEVGQRTSICTDKKCVFHSYEGKSSSPNTISSSLSPLSSGKSPFLRKKLLASRIMGSRILSGKMPLSAFAFTTPH